LDCGITNQKIKAIDMIKISGRITNTPPPLPKDGNMYHMAVRIGTPIEGVKITDGEKVVFSDKDGKYEITTDKQYLTFSKNKYVSETIDLYGGNGSPMGLPYVRLIVLKKSDGTTTETKSNSEEKMFFGLKQKFVINVAIGLAVIGIGWYFYKSKKK
jgi:hypothetical protein